MFSFAAPLAFLALAGVPALVAIYLLRSRYRRTVVSSVILWENLSPAREGGKRLERFRVPLLFFLELAVIVFLALAAAGPMIPTSGKFRPIAAVLDDSLSMRAAPGGKSFLVKGRQAVIDILNREGFSPVTIVLAGERPRILARNIKTMEEVANALERWEGFAPSAALGRALALAGEVTRSQAPVLVVTDHPPSEQIGKRIVWRAVGRALRNAGFVNASRARADGRDRCLAEIANFSDAPLDTELTIDTMKQTLHLDSNEKKRLIFETRKPGPIHISLGGDDFIEDDRIILYPPFSNRVGVEIDMADLNMKRALEKALAASGLLGAGSADLLFTDNPETIFTGSAWEVRFIREKKTGAYTGPFVADYGHPLMKGISLDGVIWGTGKTGGLSGMPVISIGDIPVLAIEEFPSGKRRIHFRIDLEMSTLHRTPAWPGLIWNLLDWRSSELPGLRSSNVRSGTGFSFTAGKPSGEIRLISPGNGERELPITNGNVLVEPGQPGEYTIQSGKKTYSFSANPLWPGESDLGDCGSGGWGSFEDSESVREDYTDLAWAFLLCALAGLAAHRLLSTRAVSEGTK